MTDSFSTADSRLRLRFAEAADLGLIVQLIRELAAYERLANQVVAGEQELRDSLFGSRPSAQVLIAQYDGQPAGFAVFFHNFSTFLGKPGLYLEDLFVRPAYQGKGIGKTLLAFLARIAEERGCGRLEWSVLNWNEAAIRLYQSVDGKPLDEWTVYRVTGAELKSLARSVW